MSISDHNHANGHAGGTDQCPSSKKQGLPADKGIAGLPFNAGTGQSYWRSLDELSQTREFREFLHREFPAFASELLDGTRRHFLKIMGASLALAGAGSLVGCRRPEDRILAYQSKPEDMIIGKPLYYATSLPLPGGGCEGLLAETYQGRPTKLEGNPLHPDSLGRSGVRAQATILDLYDPDRDAEVAKAMAEARGQTLNVTDWKAFQAFCASHIAAFDATRGDGLFFLVEKATSPSRDRLRDKIRTRWPRAQWFAYEPADNANALEGTRLAFGAPARELLDLAKAKVIVSFNRDFLGGEDATLAESRGWGTGRYMPGPDGHAASGSSMNRLYVFESMFTLTGGQADHRVTLKPSRVGAALVALANAVMAKAGPSGAGQLAQALSGAAQACAGEDLPSASFMSALVDDLLAPANRGASVICVGPDQPPAVHALAAALNSALGNIGKTVRYAPVVGDAAASSVDSIKSVCAAIDAGTVDTLVVLGCNPVYDAPADLGFAEKYAKIRHRVHLGPHDETAVASDMHLPRCHYLEAWSDVVSWDGVYSVVQPQIDPLYPSHGELEFLATILGEAESDPYLVVRQTMRDRAGAAGFEGKWRRALHDGLLAGAAPQSASRVDLAGVARAVASAASSMARGEGLELVFMPCPHVHDGRYANNGWLQELPNTVTKVAWDNPLLISRKTADRLGIDWRRHAEGPLYNHGQMVTLTVGGRSISVPVWVQPGLAEDTLIAYLGYGRTACGRVGDGTGFDTYRVRGSDSMRVAKGATVEPDKSQAPCLIACVQDHWILEGRDDIVREVDLPAWQKYGDIDIAHDAAIQKDSYGHSRDINFAGRLGMEGHTPANLHIYEKWQQKPLGLRFVEWNDDDTPKRDEHGRLIGIHNEFGKRIQQWGMSIDLTTCSGCGACTVACQAENNVPIVGKMEVAKGREMHWIRVDRYYSTAPVGEPQVNTLGVGNDKYIADDPGMMIQPVACVHCEAAPCEVVCPVNATVHDYEGTNNMAYNRCIGTRYCANNCPYKVRRFNFFDYATKQFRGDFAGQDVAEQLPKILQPPSEYFVPPRLRQKKLEVATMQSNPHVTVRSRGIMEKCTYCIQRVNAARVETKIEDLKIIPDGFVQTACEQACPTGAIVFGDIYDYTSNDGKGSRVSRARMDPRSYGLLAYLNTRPRTTHMLRLRNPNPAIRTPVTDPFHHGHSEGGHDDAHGAGAHEEGHVMSLPVLSAVGGVTA